MRIVLLGPPGAGKGTQAVYLSQSLKIPHISTGDIFRANIKGETELGRTVKSYLDSGKLVPDDITIAIVKNRLDENDCNNGFIMDGFPRTIPQAEKFQSMLLKSGKKLTAVFNIAVPDQVIIRRLSGRRMCSCGKVYHINSNPSKIQGICDSCGSPLYIRDDDREGTVLKRLTTYHEQTSPLIDFYNHEGLMIEVDGVKKIEETLKDILNALKR